jgi:hypothetical protein
MGFLDGKNEYFRKKKSKKGGANGKSVDGTL